MLPAKNPKPSCPSLGIYVHFPWCLKKCPYCDFLSIAAPRDEIPQERYTDAVLGELKQRATQLGPHPVHSIFIGGGTPSLWQAPQIGRVLHAITSSFDVVENAEVTAECNPSSFSASYARELKGAGITRVSIGVQSLRQQQLKFLGRLHDVAEATAAVCAALEAGFPVVSADLIFSAFDQSPEQAATEARRIAELGVQHLSAYSLTIEPGTQFGALHRQGRLPLLSEDRQAQSFTRVSETLMELGFEHYEVSNFARAGVRCRHNLGYWRGEPYLGLGCGAWGTLPASRGESVRYRNALNPERYMSTVEFLDPAEVDDVGSSPYQQVERLTPQQRLLERLMLNLRVREGIDISQLERELGLQVLSHERTASAERLIARGRLERCGSRLRIPHSQWLFADGTIAELA